MPVLGQLFVLVIVNSFRPSDFNSCEALSLGCSCKDYMCAFFQCHFFPCFSEKEVIFRLVGKKNVSLCTELSHRLYVIHVKSRIKMSVICHGRIDDKKRSFVETMIKIKDIVYLILASKISGIDRIKAYTFLFPVSEYGRKISGKIPYRIACETCRMGGKHR